MVLSNIRFLGVPQKAIDLDSIREFIEDTGTKRICFAFSHKNALRQTQGKDIAGWLNLPFDEPFESIARHELGLNRVLFPPKSGVSYYRRIDTEAEFQKLEAFIEKYLDIVFLRDTLDLSVALSMHESEPNVRTTLGEHEYNLKYQSENNNTQVDMAALMAEMQKRLEELPYFRYADYICCVPSDHPIMLGVISGLKGFDFVDISNQVSWVNKQGSLKNVVTAEQKLAMIQSWGLQISEDIDMKDKTVLLVDDMYQSGVSMQYVGMRLKEAGVKRVFGMTLVKSLGNQ